MPRERSYRKVPIHPTSDDVCWSEKFGGTQKENQSLFTLLIEIESRLRAETRYEKVDEGRGSETVSLPADTHHQSPSDTDELITVKE
jgi:hypothetical protein